MNYNMKESGKRIQQLRMEHGYTQEQVARLLNMDRSYYSRIESGKRGSSVDTLIHLSDIFGVSLDYLVLGLVPSIDKVQLAKDILVLMEHLEKFKSSL